MKKSIIAIAAFTLFILSSCDLTRPNEKDMARADRINGVLVFIQAEPQSGYEVIGRLQHDAITETFNQGKGKKFGEALGAMLSKSVENMSLKEQLYKMTELAKEQNPQTEAIIISDKVFDAQLIKFK